MLIDIDPQGNASTGLGLHRQDRKLTTYEVLTGQARLAEAIVPTRIPGLSLVPATVDLSGAELELIERRRGDHHKLGLALHIGFVRMSGGGR